MLFIGDDWAEDHHDIELVNAQGQVLAWRRLPEGIEGIAGLHALVGEHPPEEWAELEPEQVQGLVKVGIETDRGPWVAALVAPDTRCSRSTRCRWRATANGTPPDIEEVSVAVVVDVMQPQGDAINIR